MKIRSSFLKRGSPQIVTLEGYMATGEALFTLTVMTDTEYSRNSVV